MMDVDPSDDAERQIVEDVYLIDSWVILNISGRKKDKGGPLDSDTNRHCSSEESRCPVIIKLDSMRPDEIMARDRYRFS